MTPYSGDDAVRKALAEHACPTPFHVVRMRFLGDAATPGVGLGPAKVIESLWPDGLPVFEGEARAKALYGRLLGLWNHLGRHCRGVPLKLSPLPRPASWQDVAAALRLRCEEVEAFLTGLTVAGLEDILPPPLLKAVTDLDLMRQTLAEIAQRLQAAQGLPEEMSLDDYATLLKNTTDGLQKLIGAVAMARGRII